MTMHAEMTLTDNMFLEKEEEEDLQTLKTALMHHYNLKTAYKSTEKDWL